MSWALLVGFVLVLGLAFAAVYTRKLELERMAERVERRTEVKLRGSSQQLQQPVVDLSRCLGCGTCVVSCPEEGVLDLVHGQAAVINGSNCQGVSACARECPVGAITVTLGDITGREDIPAISDGLEAVDSPGIFLAGEVTAQALIKTAIDHGSQVAATVDSRRLAATIQPQEDVLDLCVIGAGPAGLACSLEAKKRGLSFVTLDQESTVGGTVAKYPRRKLVLTEPVELPLHGALARKEYTKEELMQLWQSVAREQQLPIHYGETFGGLTKDARGHYVVRTEERSFSARNVCLALGRRGIPRKLGVPGEDLPHVGYSLVDANSYSGRRILVVGGGDSAVEAALGLAEQPGNDVTLAYRGEHFYRLRERNELRLKRGVQDRALRVLTQTEVTAIHASTAEMVVMQQEGPAHWVLPADDVFIMAGGVPPIDLLKRSGVSFDASALSQAALPEERGTGLVRALAIGFGLALVALIFAVWNSGYYSLSRLERPAHEDYGWLRASQGFGLVLGILSTVLIAVNLAYLVRRSAQFKFAWGSLQKWMTSHVATGILAFLCALLHGGMETRNTVGGRAFWALTVLMVTGAIGRYFYAYVPRAANGRELKLAESQKRLDSISKDWDPAQRKFSQRVEKEVFSLMRSQQWQSTFFGRVKALITGERDLRRVLARLGEQGQLEGVPEERVRRILAIARGAHRTALMASHYEDLRAVLNTWRYLHRWVAAFMVLLVVCHVVYALIYRTSYAGGLQ